MHFHEDGPVTVPPEGSPSPEGNRKGWLARQTDGARKKANQAAELLKKARALEPAAKGVAGSAIKQQMENARKTIGAGQELIKKAGEQNEKTVQPAIEFANNNTRRLIGEVMDGSNALGLIKGLKQATANAHERFGLAPAAYHQRIKCPDGGPETSEHFFTAHLSPPSDQPKTLTIMSGGNNEPITQARDQFRSQRGQMNLFNRFVSDNANNVDVLQFRIGNALTTVPAQHNSVAFIHLQNIVSDALAGVGMFAGRAYRSINMYGHSYGAGALTQLCEQLEARRKQGETVPPLDRTMFVDGVEFQSIPPRSLRTRPAGSGSHFHVWQRNENLEAMGDAPLETRSADRQLQVPNTSHRRINDAQIHPEIFDQGYRFLMGQRSE